MGQRLTKRDIRLLQEDRRINAINFINNIVKEKDELQSRIDKAIENIEHELNGHILLNDEITWNKEFYTNGKLDYRKLLISLLQQTLDILKGSDKE